jgi:DNA-directed RNA polymerase specialized sigma24 family protein
MSEPGTTTVQVEHWLNRLRDGDDAARNLLFQQASRRLEKLAEYMLRGYPGVGRWEQSEDVLQNALLRLNRALSEQTPESVRHFFNLAALAIRRELLDLAKHYQGPLGQGNHLNPHRWNNGPDFIRKWNCCQTRSARSSICSGTTI